MPSTSSNDTITFAFKKRNISYKFISDIIKWYTDGEYSHVAIIVDIDGISTAYEALGTQNAVVKHTHIYDYTMYDYIRVPVNDISIIKAFLESTVGDKYDYYAIVGFIVPIRDRLDLWICSELAANTLKIDGNELLWKREPYRCSPNSFYKLLATKYLH